MRSWRILAKYSHGNFLTFQSVPHIAHVETEVFYDEIGHLAPYFTTKKSNKVKGTVTNSEASRYFERLTKCDRCKYLLKELVPASFTVWASGSTNSCLLSRRNFVCVCVCVCVRVCVAAREHTLAFMRVSLHSCVVFVCLRLCVCECVCCVFVYVCARDFFVRNSQGCTPIGQPK